MKVILHAGAHRCATTSFQEYLRQNTAALTAAGIGVWEPRHTRGGMFHGVLPSPAEPAVSGPAGQQGGRLQMHLQRSRSRGHACLLISDQNMMGCVRENLRLGELYCGVGERMTRFARAFGGAVTGVAVNLRSLDSYWASCIAIAAARGGKVSGAALRARLAASPRSWRDVLADMAAAMPGVPILALPYESFGGRPDAQLSALTGLAAPRGNARLHLGAAPRLEQLRGHLLPGPAAALPEGEGCWQPFDDAQTAVLRERYADDLMWLAAGADGLAQLVQDPDKLAAGPNPPRTDLTRGRPNDDQDRRLAGAG